MSSFFKKLLFNNDGKNKSNSTPTKSTTTMLPKDIVVELLLKECNFSSDDVGAEMSLKWSTFNSMLSHPNNGVIDLENKQERDGILLSLMCTFIATYSKVQNCVTCLNSDLNLEAFSKPKFCYEVTGHPTLFVLQVAIHMLDMLAFDGAIDDSIRNSDTSKLDINFHTLFPKMSTENTSDGNDCTFPYKKCWNCRADFVTTLQCLNVLVSWPHNCIVLKNNLGKEFVKFFVQLLQRLFEALDQTYGDYTAGCEVHAESVSQTNEHRTHLEHSLNFTITCAVLCVQVVSRCGSVSGEIEFGDLLPPQPWCLSDMGTVAGGSFAGFEQHSHEAPMTLTSPSEGAANIRPKSSQSVPSSSYLSSVAGQRALIDIFVDTDVISVLSHALRRLHLLISSARVDDCIIETDSAQGLFSFQALRSMLVLQTECLFLLNSLFAEHSASASEFCSTNQFLIFNNILVSHPSVEFLRFDAQIEKLIVRRGVICLRLNTLLSVYASDPRDSEEVAPNYVSLLELPAICEFLFWVSQQFDTVDRYLGDILAADRASPDNKLQLAVDFHDQFANPSPLSFDLWPWLLSSGPDIEHTVLLSDECSYYHLMPQLASESLKRKVLRSLSGYVVWDSILAELVGSRSFSYLRSATTTSAQPVSSSSSSSQKKKASKRNIYFVFVLFHQLFDEKLCQYGSSTNRSSIARSREGGLPLCQIKFSEYICQLFKAAEPEDIFAIINDFDLFEILFGEMFLLGGSTLSKDLLPLDAQDAIPPPGFPFTNVTLTTTQSGGKKLIWSKPNDRRGVQHCFWALLHGNALDFFNGLVVYSLYFQTSTETVRSFVGFDDVIVLLVDFVLPALRLSGADTHGGLTSTVPNSIGYQVMLLLHNLSETISSLGDREKNVVRRKIVNKLLEFAECKLRRMNPLIGLLPAEMHGERKPIGDMSGKIVFEWLECYAAVSLLVRLTSMSVCGHTNWAEIFSVPPDSEISYTRPDGGAASPSEVAAASPMKLTLSPPKFLSMKKSVNTSDANALRANEISGVNGALSVIAKSRIRSLMLLLLDSRTRAAGIHIINDIVSLCARVDVTVASSIEKGVDLIRALNLAVVAEIVRASITLINEAAQYSEQCTGFQTAVALTNTFVWLLRSSRFSTIRKVLQEVFRPFILDLMNALTTCIREFAEKNLRMQSRMDKEVVLFPLSVLLRQGLALLTSIVCADEAAKTELGLISQHTKENTEFTSHLFGNFRNIDKVKRLSAAAASAAPTSRSMPSSARGVMGFENLKELVLLAEKCPTRETIVVLFEMLLDGNCLLFDCLGGSQTSFEGAATALFLSDEDRPKIKNVNIIPDIFGLIPHCTSANQSFILESFHNLITGRASLVNLNACSLSKPRVIDLALDLFPWMEDAVQVHNVTLIQSLGKHGISVAMLKHLFRVLQSRGEARPSYSWRVIQALQGMISEEDGPRQTFVFEGANSGLKLPPIYKWPAQKAYSFCSWLKIEAPKLSASKFAHTVSIDGDKQAMLNIYSPYIVCLRNNGGAGLELYLRPSKITGIFRVVLKIYSEAGETSTLSPELKGMKVAEGRWHFLGFSVSSSSFYTKSEACIQLDDQFVRHTFNSTKLPDSITEPLIGDCVAPLRMEGHNNTMRGQMGAFYFFSESLSEGQFRSIHALGPDYIYNFEPFSASYRDMSGSRKHHQRVDPVLSILDGSLTPHIVLAYNPVVWKGELFLDNTPLKNDVRWRTLPSAAPIGLDDILSDGPGYCRMHARRLKGTYRSITQDVRLALNSLGGVKTVFPLFAQLDQPRIAPSLNLQTDTTTSSVNSAFDVNFLPSILGLLINLLENNSENQAIFLRISGFGVIAHLLERVSPEHFSSLTLDKLIELFNKLESNFPLQENFLEHILCHFKFWVFTPLAIQLRLFSLLGELISISTQYLCEALSFQRLIDLLYLLYDYEAPHIDRVVDQSADQTIRHSLSSGSAHSGGHMSRSHSSRDLAGSASSSSSSRHFLKSTIYSSDVWVRVDTGETVGVKLKGNELFQVRSRIFSLLSGILQSNRAFLPEDVQTLVLYLVQASSATTKVEILSFLLNLLSNENSNFLCPHLLLGFAIGNAIKHFNTLYGHEDTQIRLLTLLLFCKVLNLCLDYKLLPDIPKASKYFKTGANCTGSNTAQSDDYSMTNPGASSTGGRGATNRDDATSIAGDMPTFSDTLDALGLVPTNVLSILLFIQEQLLSRQSRDSFASRQLQNKIVAYALQLAMVGESCAFLVSVVMEVFGAAGEVGEEMLARATQSMDVQFEEFQNHKLPTASLCIPMIFLSLLSFVDCDAVAVELRLTVLLNLKTCVSKSARNCDRLLVLPQLHELLLRLMINECSRSSAILAVDGASDKALSKSVAVREVCLRILCDTQTTAVRIGCSADVVQIARHSASSSKELTAVEVVKCITRGDRCLGATAVINVLDSMRRLQTSDVTSELMRSTGLILLDKVIASLQNENQTLYSKSTEQQSSWDLIRDHAEKILHLNTWLTASSLLDFVVEMSVSDAESVDREHRRVALWESAQQLLKLLDPLQLSVPAWMFEEKSFRVQAGAASPEQTLEKMTKLLTLPSARLRTHVSFTTVGGSPNSAKHSAARRLPISHAPGGLCWLTVRILCGLHLADSPTATQSSECGDCTFSICNRLKEIFRSAEKFPDFYEREAFYVISLLSEAMRKSGAVRSEQWAISTIELVIELATSVKDTLVALVADGSYEQSFSALSEHAPSSDRGLDSEDSRPSKEVLEAAAAAALLVEVSHDDLSAGYKVLLGSLTQLLTLSEDEQSAADIWSGLMQKQLRASQVVDEAVMMFRLRELNVCIPTFPSPPPPPPPPPSPFSNSPNGLSKHFLRSEDKDAANEWFVVSQAWKNACVEAQNARLRDWIKQLDGQSRRYDAKWTSIFTELANERGPWGYGAGDQREVYWMLDSCETNLHVKMRMRRNEAGTRHLMAAQKSFGRHSHSTDSHLDLPSLNQESSGIQGIYKDLKKYKKKQQLANKPFSQQQDAEGGVAGLKKSGTEEESDEDGYSDPEDDATVMESASASSEVNGIDLNLVLFRCEAEVITAATNSSGGHTPGKVEVTKTRVSFARANESDAFDFTNKTGNTEFMWACQGYPSCSWSGDDICAVYERLYQMRHVAVELFFTSRTSVLLNLYDVKHAKKLCRLIRTRVRTVNLNTALGGRPKEAIARSMGPGGLSLTQAWIQHKITNFEYLMHLNITAGRTFNDLAQYPVFPWVLSDYTSPRIDLRDPKFFRNFHWPMGAQVDSQRQLLQEKYEASASLQDDEVLPYHTGSHYSTAAMVIWYLIRMEPFTSFHVWLQDGKFDRPDRLFHSIDSTWRGCTSNPQDVKELIPEFFFNPEFLENVNDISFGTRQNGKNIDNVDMPAWCKDASDFVRINREALESDYVSRNLHHWIDLVFGYKQRPPHLVGGSELAVDACNVFVHLTYPDAVNLEEIKTTDEVLYERTIRQIDNYGQTPTQLFERAHPERLPIDRVDIIWPIASVVTGVDTVPRAATAALQQQQQLDKPSKVLCYGDFKVSASSVLLIAVCGGVLEKLVVVDSTRVIGYHGFQVRQPDIVPPFALKVDKSALLVSASVGRGKRLSSYLSLPSSGHTKEKLAGVPFASHGVLSQSQQTGKMSASLNDFDYARIGTLSNKASFLDEEHQSRVKSVENDRRFQHSKSSAVSPKISKSRSATNLSVSDTVQPSNSTDNTGKSGVGGGGRQINRRERVDEHLSCNLYALLPDSKLLFSCAHWDNSFKVTAVDTGRLIQSVSHHREVVTCVAVASDFGRHWLVTGSKDCIVIVWELCPEKDCEPITTMPLHILYGHDDSVNCLAVSPELDLIVSGSDDGTVIIHTLRDGTYLRSILIGISQSMYAKAVSSLLSSSGGQKEPSSPHPGKLTSSTSHASMSSVSSKRSAAPRTPRSDNPQIYKRRVHLVVITREGYIVTYSADGNLLSTHTMNGRYVKMVDVKERLYAMCLSEDGKVLITGGERCLVVIRWVNNLTLANNGPRKDLDSVIDGSHDQEHAPFQSPIRSLCLTAQERHLIVGLESGHIRVLAQDSEYLRRKLHRKLMEIGILTF